MATEARQPRYAIHIASLLTPARVGVLPAEQQAPQSLELDVTLHCCGDPAGLADNLQATVDYAAVAAAIRLLAMEKHRNLIETLAADICRHLIAFHPVIAEVTVEVRKFILPGTNHVAVRWSDNK